jgi:hypothetical protein
MTKDDVKKLFLRLKSHYPSFDSENYKLDEWYKYLKEYDSLSINDQFDKYLKSDYATYEPKVSGLIKYAKKVNEKNKPIYIRCQLCKATMLLEHYDKHYHRELSVKYIEKMALKHFNKEIDFNKYMLMDDKEFDERYEKLLMSIKDKISDEKFHGLSSRDVIEKILANENM